MTLTIGSLFTGAGMLDRAVEEVFGARTAWVSEIDKGACKVLAHRYPGVPNLGDITTIDWSTVEPVDIIAGGSPCQDLSTAGRRAGMTDGTRSNLWVQMREAIAHVQPTFVVWENVRGALSARAASDLEHCPGCMGNPADRGPVLRALGRVLGDLADLGYDTEWRGLRAADVGACHGRFRVFVLAYARGLGGHETLEHDGRRAAAGDRASVPDQRHREPLRPGPERADGLTLLPTPTSNIGQNGGPQYPAKRRAGGHSVSIEDAIHGLALLPTPTACVANDCEGPETWLARRERVKETANNGNGMGMPLTIAVQLLPTPTTEPMTGNGHARNLGKEVRLLPTPSVADAAGGHERRGGARGDELLLKGIAKYERWGDYAPAIARHERAFGYPAPSPTEPAAKPLNRHGNPRVNPRLSARFVEWMMMLPAGWITDVPGVTRTEALKMLGNGVVPPQAVAALRDMKRHITPTQEATA